MRHPLDVARDYVEIRNADPDGNVRILVGQHPDFFELWESSRAAADSTIRDIISTIAAIIEEDRKTR